MNISYGPWKMYFLHLYVPVGLTAGLVNFRKHNKIRDILVKLVPLAVKELCILEFSMIVTISSGYFFTHHCDGDKSVYCEVRVVTKFLYIILKNVRLHSANYVFQTRWGFFPHGATAPRGPGPSHYRGFTITLRHTTLGRTPLDE